MLNRWTFMILMMPLMSIACAKTSPRMPALSQRDYQLRLQAKYQSMERPTEEHVLKFHTMISLTPLKQHRDDSSFVNIAFAETESHLNDQVVDIGLNAKWIEARVFEHGELLKLRYTEQLTQDNPYMDAVDILWMILFPNPPALEKGRERMAPRRYPLVKNAQGRAYTKSRATWNLLEQNSSAKISYQSDLDVYGAWRELSLSGEGKADGVVWIPLQGGLPNRHEGTLQRTICYDGSVSMCQEQQFQFLLEARP
ncbi:MAG: hypothetical protein VX278_01565 [Myxococcota bacterium]|nr:hypothetical protein [Myxococcota bacterium]